MCVVAALEGGGGGSMQDNYVPCKYVHTRVTRYYASVVDLRWCQAIHCCDRCNFLQQVHEKYPKFPKPPPGKLCGAVHYGICSAIKLAPANGPRSNVVATEKVSPPTPPTPPTPVNVSAAAPTTVLTPVPTLVPTTIFTPVPTPVPTTVLTPVPAREARVVAPPIIEQIIKEPIEKAEPLRGVPDGLPTDDNAFLLRKQREKRERDLRQKEKAQQNEDQAADKTVIKVTDKPVTPATTSFTGVPAGDGVVSDAVEGIKKKDGLIAKTISMLKQQQQPSPQSHGPVVVDQLSSVQEPLPHQQDNQQSKVVSKKPGHVQSSPVDSGTPSSNKVSQTPQKPSNKSIKGAVTSQPDKPKDAPRIAKDTSLVKNGTRVPQPNVPIPQFYFPLGTPNQSEDLETTAQKIKDAFAKVEGGKVHRSDMGAIAKASGFPFYWKCPLFCYAGGEKNGHVTLQSFLASWRKLVTSNHDDASRFLRIVTQGAKSYITDEDMLPLIQDVVDAHPGLSFLQDAPEFHSRYVQTVISRIFYCVNRSWSGKITVTELRKSNFLQTLQLLEEEDDINQVMDFFSYEHFYVIYCKFWELDKDHDLFINQEDLSRHNEHALSMRMIDRIFSGTVTRHMVDEKMNYKDFVWFLISEEDKRHPTSVEYWFRCMDLDGDGVISMYEMEYFYEEQVQKMEALGIETLPFEDCLCQMLDMIKPAKTESVSLRDLKACKLTPIFFDTFFNLEKYLEHEQKDPFASVRDGEEEEMSDWERYAAEEYEILVAEEGANEEINYEDDFEPEMEQLSPTGGGATDSEVIRLTDPPQQRRAAAGARPSSPTEDIYDFTATNSDNLGF